jgi:hypothetical protein
MTRRCSELSERLGNLEGQLAESEKKIVGMLEDRSEQERVIRRTLGYVRPDEIVMEFNQ